MQVKYKLVLSAISLLVAYGFGRWSAPEVVRTETKTVEVERKREETKTDTSRDTDKEITVTETKRPDGTEERVTRTTVKQRTEKATDTKQVTKTNKETDQRREEIRPSGKTTLLALIGIPFTGGTPMYGASVSKQVLGPIAISVWGFSNATVGTGIGLSF
jgi:hypothetical protein